jgi:uncharacterized protein YndB with AHSA1/START domain
MASILLRFPVQADPETVYDALATQDGVRQWWSEKTSGPSGTGSIMKVSFPETPMAFDFRVDQDVASERVVWRCLSGPPEWIDTDISFDIQPGDDEPSVLFTHDGWASTEQSFPFIAYSWAQILPRLKELVETGTANPYFRF